MALTATKMADPADPCGRGSKDGGNLSSHSSEGGDPSDRDDPRHESLLGRDSATEEPMEGVEASGSTSPRPKTGRRVHLREDCLLLGERRVHLREDCLQLG